MSLNLSMQTWFIQHEVCAEPGLIQCGSQDHDVTPFTKTSVQCFLQELHTRIYNQSTVVQSGQSDDLCCMYEHADHAHHLSLGFSQPANIYYFSLDTNKSCWVLVLDLDFRFNGTEFTQKLYWSNLYSAQIKPNAKRTFPLWQISLQSSQYFSKLFHLKAKL